MKDKVLAVDIGTSSVRAMIVDATGRIICQEQTGYDIIIIDKYMQEQNPDQLWHETVETIKRCVKNAGIPADDLACLGFSSQLYNIFPVDAAGAPLFNLLPWSDSRSEAQAARLKADFGPRYLYEETGCPMNSLYPISKILWLHENRPELAARAHKFITIKEYVLHKITGDYLVDYSMAAASGLLNIHTLQWSDKALAAINLSQLQLSTPVSGLTRLAFKNSRLREELGLPPDIMLISGAGDGPLANIGSGAYREGAINIDLGTSGAARVLTGRPIIDTGERLWCYAVTDSLWVYGGMLSNVGNGYNWLVNNIAEFSDSRSKAALFELIDTRLAATIDRPHDLLFIPYLLKARSPYWDDRVKATIYGLTHEHTLIDIIRAYLESIGFNLLAVIDILNEQVACLPRIVLTGGMAKSPRIAQMLADILGAEIETQKNNEGSIMGAAVFALYAAGLVNAPAFDPADSDRNIFQPDSNRHLAYRKQVARYAKLQSAIHDLELD